MRAIPSSRPWRGGYIIAGRTFSFGAGCADVYLIKTDSSGDTLWTKTFGWSSGDEGSSVQQIADGGYIVTGCANSLQGHGSIYLIKTSAAGDSLWTRTYGGTSFVGRAYSVQQTSDGGYVIAGYAVSAGSQGLCLIKTDSAGDTAWTKTYGGTTGYGYSVEQTADGGYIVTGSTFGTGSGHVYLVKTNATGDTIWTKTYGEGDDDCGWSVRQTTDGGYVIAGQTGSEYRTGGYDVYLVKTNPAGDTVWTKTYGGKWGDWGKSVRQTSDGGYIIAGSANSFGPGDYDVYLIKTDANGSTVEVGQ